MLQIQELCKAYDSHTVLDNINLRIQRGQLFGLVGPNGAGKTTILKVLAGLLEHDLGTIVLDGEETSTRERRGCTKISYMPDYFGVYPNLKVYEYMEFYTQLYGYKGKEARKRIEENLELVSLYSKKDEYVETLSRGVKQKLSLARCLIAEPELLLLDEPSSGLDPRACREIEEVLHTLQKKQITIIISSHILHELSRICTNIGIIDHGKLIIDGRVEDILKMEEKSKPLRIRFTEVNANVLKYLDSHALISNLIIDGTQVMMQFQGDSLEEASLLSALIRDGAGICYFAREESSLEQLFLEITKGES
ncbi:ABC transporter ATP-binding protein [Anaerosporobacter sp.]|uniref:ABC transporter ATP-binding protein n=1 Tax=Anaerosporobacter sp. TaxID=1872529 RepID=UPI00286F5C73|nr:ABC transporter ATP-binding protein [Anaerosporobacter sp.]